MAKMGKQKKSSAKSILWLSTLKHTLPILLLLLVGGWVYGKTAFERELNNLRAKETLHLGLGIGALSHHIEEAIRDLLFLVGDSSLNNAINNPSTENLAQLAEDFASFVSSTKSYNQIRLLDETGMEKMRVNDNHPDLPDVRKNYAKYPDAMSKLDREIGASLKKLEEMGLADNTIVIHNSDHGGVLPRSKRYLFGSGIHCPLIIRIPDKYKDMWPAKKPGMKIERLVSFVDMPKTWLSITDSAVPDYMQGTIFLGPRIEPEPKFHFSFRGRMDERNENARAVCDKQYLYIRNYMPYVPWMQHLEYLWKMAATVAWEEHVKSGMASEVQARFFKPKGCTEEFYDMHSDPDNVNNLINDSQYTPRIDRMRKALRSWQEEIYDTGLLPESEMVRRAAEHDMTIYDMVRDPKLYNLTALLDAADLALEQKSKNLSALKKLLTSSDSGLRYWAIVGCFLLDDQQAGLQCMEDKSHEVRAMAAWILVRTGDKAKGLKCMEGMLKQNSYATLSILNIIDWMGDDGKTLMPLVQSLKLKNYEAGMQGILLLKYDMPI